MLLPKDYYKAPGMSEDAFAAAYMRLDEAVRRKIGHHFQEFDVLPGIELNNQGFFKSCQFQGEDCVDEE